MAAYPKFLILLHIVSFLMKNILYGIKSTIIQNKNKNFLIYCLTTPLENFTSGTGEIGHFTLHVYLSKNILNQLKWKIKTRKQEECAY